MAKFQKSIVIEAPVDKVFDFMDDPNNLPQIWPSMVEVKDVGRAPSGGAMFRYVYKMAGFRLEGISEDTEYVKNVRTVSKTSGGVDATATLLYEAAGQGTRVTVIDEYKVPVPMVGKLAESIIVRMNEQEAETLLANLKIRMEA
jgi:uncharacterized membrane protein